MQNRSRLSFSSIVAGGIALGIAGCTPSHHEPTDAAYGGLDGESVGVSAAAEIPSATAPAEARKVAIDNFTFDPPILEVPVGSTVTWTNRDDVPHTVTSVDKKFASPALDTDEKFSQTFTAPGTYAYFCAVHTHMTGKIIVK